MRKILILADQFPPRKGGVSTWMENIASILGVSHEVVVADLSESAENRRPGTDGFAVEKYTGFPYRAIRETVRSAERAAAAPRMEGFADVLKLFLLMRPEELEKLFFVLKLVQTHRFNRFDRIIACNPAPMGYPAVFARFLFGIPFAAVCHGGELLYHRSRGIESKKLSAVLNGADVLVANSRFTRSLLMETGCAAGKIRIIHPGVDVRHFCPGPKDRRLIAELGVGNRIILLTVAHLVEHKNHPGVLAVLAALIGKYPNLHYLIMGSGPYGRQIEEETLRLGLGGHATFLKQASYGDLPRYYRLCDIYIMLSRRMAQSVEGFGIAFLEAGACGKPVIGMEDGGIPDAVEHNRSGFLVGNITEAVEKTEILIRDGAMRRRMGEYARRRCESRFSWEDGVRRIEDLLFSGRSAG